MDPTVARILDANANRAGEGLRVIEDYARFGCDDRAVAARVKAMRHELAAAMALLPVDEVLAGRDTPGDTGTTIATDAEYDRPDVATVVAAACKRVAQALRALEEYAKTVDPMAARRFEQLRYTGYDVEQTVLLRSDLRRRMADVRLYVLITEDLCKGDWLATAEAAIIGGADCVQLREKDLPDGELLNRAKALTELAHRHEGMCIINDRPDIARLAGADGVHVGQDDLTVAQARRIAGGNLLVGISTHSPEQIQAAASQNPDYLAIGPMFTSPTKPEAERHAPRDQLIRSARAEYQGPVVAIGGIDADNVSDLKAAGVRTVCVCSSVIATADAKAAAGQLKTALGG